MDLKYTTLPSLFSAIADEIRTKKGTSNEIVADDFPDEISTISSGGGSVIPPDLPKDGKTRICYQIPEGTTGDDLVLTLGIKHDSASSQTTVDWGDGSARVVSTGTGFKELTHIPSAAGTYVATITVDAGSVSLGGGNSQTIYGAYNKNNAGKMRQYILWCVVGDDVVVQSYAFYYCTQIKEIKLPTTATSVGDYAFCFCQALAKITLNNNITSISQNAFQRCGDLTTITIPSGVASIGTTAFQDCINLTEITIPSGVTSIGNNTFNTCASLTTITIPSGVASIGTTALGSLYGLKKLIFKSTIPPVLSASSALFQLPTTCIISVPVGSLSAYQTATNYPSSATYTYIEEA